MRPFRTHDWAIILAGGSGSRLAAVARDHCGRPVPKQYCSLRGGRSLLADALLRARRVVPRQQIVVVVAVEHRGHWEPQLSGSGVHVVVQPRNRGTAPGLLLPLFAVLERDPAARIALLPADHFVAREDVLARSQRQAMAAAAAPGGALELLGIEPDADEPGLGWILPGPHGTVRAFVEKPDAARAAVLRRRGALWNSMLAACPGDVLLDLYRRRLPQLVAIFERTGPHRGAQRAAQVYRTLPAADFSRDVLSGAEPFLRVHRVPPCGWTDLGTPERVLACLRRHPPLWSPPQPAAGGCPDLASAVAAAERTAG